MMQLEETLREKLAAMAHESWSGWTKYMLSKCNATIFAGGRALVIPPASVERWERQMNTLYADLPEKEKESDRLEADKYSAFFCQYILSIAQHVINKFEIQRLKTMLENHRKKSFVTCDEKCFCFEIEAMIAEYESAVEYEVNK